MNKLIQKYNQMTVQVRASFWFLICSFLQKGISVVTTPIFTRLLTTEEYGLYNVFNSWLGIVTVFVSMNLFQGVYAQGVVKFEDDRDVFSSSMQGLNLTLLIAWLGVYLLFRNFINDLLSITTVHMFCMLILIWATAVFRFWATEQRVMYKYRLLVAVTLIISLCKPLVGIIMVMNSQDKVTARILGLTLVELIGYTGFFFVQFGKGKVFYSGKYWKYALCYNIPLIPHYLSSIVLSSSDRLMINSMVNASAAGIYALAYSVSQLMIIFNSSINQTLTPWIYQKIKSGKTEGIGRIVNSCLLFVASFNCILIFLAPEVVSVFAPRSYYVAIWAIPPVAMSVYFIFCYDMFSKFAFYYEKTTLIAGATVCGALLNIVLNYIFIKQFGFVAAGYTTLVCYLLFSILHYLVMANICRKNKLVNPIKLNSLLQITVPFCAISFLAMMTYKLPVIRYGIVGLACVVIILYRRKIIRFVKELLEIKKAPKHTEQA